MVQDGAVRGKVAANRGWGEPARFAACRDARVMSSPVAASPEKRWRVFLSVRARVRRRRHQRTLDAFAQLRLAGYKILLSILFM